MFQAFRRSPAGYWAYQEPVHEAALSARNNPDILTGYTSETLSQLRHPHLDLSYFYELQQVHTAWCDVIEKRFIYDDYFGATSIEILGKYFRALIAAAKGRPVIQECRTASRIGAIKEIVGGTHLYLWRNLWDQWWSLKVNEYFNAACQIILNAHVVPPIILRLRNVVSYTEFHEDNIYEEFRHFQQRPLSAEDSYLVFYTLWCLGLLEGQAHADLMINIDRLSNFGAYRQDVANRFQSFGITAVDLSDCHVPQGCYDQSDQDFFKRVEARAHGLLLTSGHAEHTVDGLKNVRDEYAPLQTLGVSNDSLARDLQRVRGIVLRRETSEAEQLQNLHQTINEVQVHFHSKAQQLSVLDERLQNLNLELQHVQAESAVRERTSVEQLESVQREMKTLLQQQTQREQEISAQLFALQEQSAAGRTELTRQHNEQLQALEHQREEHEWLTGERLQALNLELQHIQAESTVRERTSVEQLESVQREMKTLLQQQTQREQEISAQLFALQQEGHQTQMDLIRSYDEQKRELEHQYTEREHAVIQHWQMVQQQTLFEAHQAYTLTLQHLQDQLQAESIVRQQKHMALKALQQEFTTLRSTFAWRLTAPLRSVEGWFNSSPKLAADEKSELVGSQTIASITHSPPETSQHGIPPEQTSQNPATEDHSMAAKQSIPATSAHARSGSPPGVDTQSSAATIVNEGNSTNKYTRVNRNKIWESQAMPIQHIVELFALDGQDFITEAYRNLFGREPDPHGMAYYLGRLAMGYGKASVITDLAQSAESRPHREIIGLHKLIITERRANHWLWGRFVTSRALLRRLGEIENVLGIMATDIRRVSSEQVELLSSVGKRPSSVAEPVNISYAFTNDSSGAQSDEAALSQSVQMAECGLSKGNGPASGAVTISDSDMVFQIGQKRSLRVEVCNHSDIVWEFTTGNPLSLSYHWRYENGEMCLFNGLRTKLIQPVAQGEASAMTVNVDPPTEPGRYMLQITLVLDGHYWFEERGLYTELLPVQVHLSKLSWRANEIYENLKSQLANQLLGQQ